MGTTEQHTEDAFEVSLRGLLEELGSTVLALDTAERVLCGDELVEAA